MEKLAKYRQIVRELLIAHATPNPQNEPNIECQLIFDTEHDHYQILDIVSQRASLSCARFSSALDTGIIKG
jgi:XisI protein